MPDSNIPAPVSSSDSMTRLQKLRALNLFSTSYARAAFSFWKNPIDEVVDALNKGKNVAICAPQGVGKTGFACPEITHRWNLSSPNSFAKFIDDGDEIDWMEGFDVAIIDEASRFCTPRRDYIDMTKYSSIPEKDERLGANASCEDLPYLLSKAEQNNVQLVLIVPNSTSRSRLATRATLLQHGLTVVEINSPTFNPNVINQYLTSAGFSDDVARRITSDRFLLDPTVFCEFTIELLKDSIEHDVELSVENLEFGLRYWADPNNSLKPVWSRPRKDDLWGTLDDEALWKISSGSVKDKIDFLEKIGLDINALIAENTADSPTSYARLPIVKVQKTDLSRDF